jgi:uncharacterized protein
MSGRGQVHAYTVSRRPANADFEPLVPYVVGLIELAEGPRLLSNIVDVHVDGVRCGLPVQAVFREVAQGVTLPLFVPAESP